MKEQVSLAAALLVLAACAGSAPPDYAAQLEPALDSYVSVWNSGKFDELDAVLAANFHRRSSGGMNCDDLAGMKKLMADFRGSFPDLEVVIDESHFDKDVAFVLWTGSGTNTGPGALPPTGKSAKVSGATLLRYRDGKIAEELVYFDALDMQQQLGFVPMPVAVDPAPETK
jgi:steroid delta-isomerase-like uncharacterized protein